MALSFADSIYIQLYFNIHLLFQFIHTWIFVLKCFCWWLVILFGFWQEEREFINPKCHVLLMDFCCYWYFYLRIIVVYFVYLLSFVLFIWWCIFFQFHFFLLYYYRFVLEPKSVLMDEQEQKFKDSETAISSLQV